MLAVDKPEDYVRRVDEGLLRIKGETWDGKNYGARVPSTLRVARVEDRIRLADVHRVALPGYPYPGLHDPAYHEKNLADPYSVRIVAEVGGEIAGAGCLGINPYCLLGELKQMVVHPEHRGKGLANALIGVRLEIAKEIGIEYVDTHARTREPAVQQALLNNGMMPIAITRGIYPVHHSTGTIRENMVLMMKHLNDGEKRIDREDKILPEILEVIS